MQNLSLILSIIALVAAFVALDRTRRATTAQPTPPPRPVPVPQPAGAALAQAPAPADIAPEILAVIAAAVSMVCGPNARIADVQPAAAAAGAGNEATQLWALEGRRTLHSTHRPR